jgi:hypothetical protein
MTQEGNKTDSQFYLYFNEGFHDEEPRCCTRIKEISFATGSKIGLLVGIYPPCSGRLYGPTDGEIHFLLLSALFAGQTFSPVEKWPMQVHIYVPLVESPELRDHLKVAEVNNIALGEILRNQKTEPSSTSMTYPSPKFHPEPK